jgi:RNA polymerase sigma-70 factor (ECF subfamily)
MMRCREEAEDILQEAFTEAFFSIKNFRFESAFGVWLKRIVVNKCINKIRKRKIDLIFTDNIGDREDTNDIIESDNNDYMLQQVMNAFELLPDGYRIIFSLYMIEGYDHTEISKILGISESTSRTQYLKARRKIKELIGCGEKKEKKGDTQNRKITK